MCVTDGFMDRAMGPDGMTTWDWVRDPCLRSFTGSREEKNRTEGRWKKPSVSPPMVEG